MDEDLIYKFFAGEITDTEMDLLKAWLDIDPENRRIFNEGNELWQNTGNHTKLIHYDTDASWINIYSRLNLGKNDNKSVTILGKNNFRILLAAASIAFLVAIGSIGLLIMERPSFEQISDSWTIISTGEGEKTSIILNDSSKIILNASSSLTYNSDYNLKDRVVKLKGEAFFDVETNPEKPFVVQVPHMDIVATGTRFNVFSFKDEDRIETTLEEGVLIVTLDDIKPITLKAGQQIVYFETTHKSEVRVVEPNTYSSWTKNQLRFFDSSFEEVLRGLSRKFNVRFEIRNSYVLDLKYTATFIDESIEEVMEMLKTVSPITYEIIGNSSVNDKEYIKPTIIIGLKK